MKLVNTNEHRIYRGDNAEQVIRAGAVFDGDTNDLKRPGIERYHEGDEIETHPHEGERSVSAEHAEEVAALAQAAARKGHEQLRDKLTPDGHAVPGTADEPAGELPVERPVAEQGTTAPGADAELAAQADDADLDPSRPKKELQAVAEREGVEFAQRDTREQLVEKIREARSR